MRAEAAGLGCGLPALSILDRENSDTYSMFCQEILDALVTPVVE